MAGEKKAEEAKVQEKAEVEPKSEESAAQVLSSDHVKKLQHHALRGAAVFLVSLVWWGRFAMDALNISVEEACKYCGLTATVVLIWTFIAPLTVKSDCEANKWGFILFWFAGSIFFDIVWEIPSWSVPAIQTTNKSPENLWWGIIWWSYTLCDAEFANVTPMMFAFELWWLFGNLAGMHGLWMYRKGETKKALLCLMVCGALQAYNATLYLFFAVHVNHMEAIAKDWMSQCIYWGLNGFWALAATLSAWFCWELLTHPEKEKQD